MSKWGWGWLVALVLALSAGPAMALDGTAAQILVRNGAIALVVPITVDIDHSSTGTLILDQTTGPTTEGQIAWDATNDEIEVGDGAGTQRFIPVGTTTDTLFCTYDGTNNEIDCNSSAASALPQLFFSTVGDVTASTTLFANVSQVSATENNVEMAVNTANYEDIRCEASAAITGANTVTITGRKGTCGTLADDVDVQCVITGGATSCTDLTGVLDVTAGQCMAFSMAWSASAETAYVNCTIERTS